MFKPVYKNPKSKKYYTIHDEEDGSRSLKTVFCTDDQFNVGDFKQDKAGRAYKLLDIETAVTKNGYLIYRPVKK